VATISNPSTPANDPASRRTIRNVATSARAIATGLTPKHSGMPWRAPPIFSSRPYTTDSPSGYFGKHRPSAVCTHIRPTNEYGSSGRNPVEPVRANSFPPTR